MKKLLATTATAIASFLAFAAGRPVAAVTDNGSVAGVVTTLSATGTPSVTGQVLGETATNAGILSYWWVILLIVAIVGVVIYFMTKKS